MFNIFKPATFEWWQMAILKITLLSVGILLGVYFTPFFKKYKGLWFFLWIVGGIYLITVWHFQ
jgi:hypothetical protein